MTQPSADTSSEYRAALDIGSNSFHFVLARQVEEQVQILHAEKYRVQLAQGLDQHDVLSQEAIVRGVAVLQKLAISTQHIAPDNFRAVATYTLRQASNAAAFLKAAEKVFPFPIEIISGHEEARLIYQGVAHHRQNNHQQLVIDIGGGSTECIIGQSYDVKRLDSLNMGCVSYQQQFFPEGKITAKAFKEAIRSASHEVDNIVKRFSQCGWQHVLGTSGTIKAIANIVNAENEIIQPVTLRDVKQLKKQLLAFDNTQDIQLAGLKESRRAVICSGVAILQAVMQCLDIKEIEYCQYALREGVLFEQAENVQHNNVRQRTIDGLATRFNIDTQQASIVNKLTLTLYQQTKEAWQLNKAIYKELLTFAALIHELGVDINASGYQKHGQYIIEQADLAGFNQEQQRALAWIVGNQRKRIIPMLVEQSHHLSTDILQKLCVLLRLSVLLSQQRQQESDYPITLHADDNKLTLAINRQWLKERPIIDTELFYEVQQLEKIGITLLIKLT